MPHPRLILCGRSAVPHHLDDPAIVGVLSIGDDDSPPPEGLDLSLPTVTRLCFVDAMDDDDPGGPTSAHVSSILEFGDWFAGLESAVLVHCTYGVSRSTAAGLVLLAQWLGPGREGEAVAALFASQGGHRSRPNPRMVRLGDALLQRSGRLVAALSTSMRDGGGITCRCNE